jgi:hypothetical protein
MFMLSLFLFNISYVGISQKVKNIRQIDFQKRLSYLGSILVKFQLHYPNCEFKVQNLSFEINLIFLTLKKVT